MSRVWYHDVQMKKQTTKSSKKIVYYTCIAVAIVMLPFTQLIFKVTADSYVKPCPEFSDYGACRLQYGLSASVMGTAAAVVWVLMALTILAIGVYKLKKSIK
jgi:hypothetical protein